jgi:hypothetical protein
VPRCARRRHEDFLPGDTLRVATRRLNLRLAHHVAFGYHVYLRSLLARATDFDCFAQWTSISVRLPRLRNGDAGIELEFPDHLGLRALVVVVDAGEADDRPARGCGDRLDEVVAGADMDDLSGCRDRRRAV